MYSFTVKRCRSNIILSNTRKGKKREFEKARGQKKSQLRKAVEQGGNFNWKGAKEEKKTKVIDWIT